MQLSFPSSLLVITVSVDTSFSYFFRYAARGDRTRTAPYDATLLTSSLCYTRSHKPRIVGERERANLSTYRNVLRTSKYALKNACAFSISCARVLRSGQNRFTSRIQLLLWYIHGFRLPHSERVHSVSAA